MKIEYMKLEELIPYEKNAKKHPKQQTQNDKWADFLRGESYGA